MSAAAFSLSMVRASWMSTRPRAVSWRSLTTTTTTTGSTGSSSSSGAATATTTATTNAAHTAQAERTAYLRDANQKMQQYHDAKILMKQGKLPNRNQPKGDSTATTTAIQGAILVTFLVAFMVTPLVGKKIAQDEDFRKAYIPSWYDYTVPQPENPWTREELHEQMVAVQRDIHERAAAGDFTPEKLSAMRASMMSGGDGNAGHYAHREGLDMSKIPTSWDRIHPGDLDDDDDDE